MGIAVRIFFGLIVAGAVGWVGYFYSQNKRLPTMDEVSATAQQVPSLFTGKTPVLSSLPEVDQESSNAFSSAVSEGTKRANMVLGEAIEVASDSSKPAVQKALDYGRYLYCQQVVVEYEADKPNVAE